MHRTGPNGLRYLCCIAALLLGAMPFRLAAQPLLHFVNADTEVSRLSFRFAETQTFDEERLRAQLATVAPRFINRFDRLNPFVKPQTYPFDPIELQKDVVRLRRFYDRNGFPEAQITYTSSQLDTTDNDIHVILVIREGRPLTIGDFTFTTQEGGYLTDALPAEDRAGWIRFRDQILERTTNRFTEIEQIRAQDETQQWLQNQGYAFAKVQSEAEQDSTYRLIDLTYIITPGPKAYIDEIEVEGAESIRRSTVLRELPFEAGDRFSSSELRKGQQELFGLNLFRVVLAEVPDQEEDSTVTVRLRVREARPRYITAELGYGRTEGISVESSWQHRNFAGGARNLRFGLLANTGLLGTTGGFDAVNTVGKLPARLLRGTLSIRQPYFFSTRLSAILAPFAEVQNDPQLPASGSFLDMNRGEYGLAATFIFEALPYRFISARYSISQVQTFFRQNLIDQTFGQDLYNKGELELTATLGRVDNYLDPQRGYLLRPFAITAGQLFFSDAGIQYNKIGMEAVGYQPIGFGATINGRLVLGKMWAKGASRTNLDGRNCALQAQPVNPTNTCFVFENRFDPVFFYAGGSSDVRGWGFQLLGGKVARADTLRENGQPVLDENGNAQIQNYYYERLGGTGKLAGNIELRTRIPGFGPEWQGAAFFDFGQVSNGRFRLEDFRYSVGTGMRYKTVLGVLRFDIAYKIKTDEADLRLPRDVFLFNNGLTTTPPEARFIRRFELHASIGHVF